MSKNCGDGGLLGIKSRTVLTTSLSAIFIIAKRLNEVKIMSCYLISYDLRNARDYESLYDAIRSYGTYAHVLESTWAIKTDKSAVEVRDHLTGFIDSDDGIFVVKSAQEAAWRKAICKDEWLKNNL